ncbi:unnamed protein product [Prorocentrum cordatum]|uniref:Peptidase A1 domain-containing protein n=1 Tax=Prorocentrum cordatum TaxID=2364126 RepID=A0ABN9TZ07_9DINO|nr:unnamed protein product [Polarella glacialis]
MSFGSLIFAPEADAFRKHSTPIGNATNGLVTIPLDKQYVPVKRNNRTVTFKTAYFGTVYVGLPQPQKFTVVFDTGSGHVVLPSSKCASETCVSHRRYERGLSESAVDLNADGEKVSVGAQVRDTVQISFGTGQLVGDIAEEVVCFDDYPGEEIAVALHSGSCARVRTVLATEMTAQPFLSFEFDGVLGLGLDSLALHPDFSFFGQMSKQHSEMQAVFGVFISGDDCVPSEISFGGHDPRRAASEMLWAPVERPEMGYWQLSLKRVTVDGEPLECCESGGCAAVVDTGTSLFGVPRGAAKEMHLLLSRQVDGDATVDASAGFDCRQTDGCLRLWAHAAVPGGPGLFPPCGAGRGRQQHDQPGVQGSSAACGGEGSTGSKTWILGEPVLRRYYTAFDWRQRRVGFARAAPPRCSEPEGGDVARRHRIVGAPAETCPRRRWFTSETGRGRTFCLCHCSPIIGAHVGPRGTAISAGPSLAAFLVLGLFFVPLPRPTGRPNSRAHEKR